MEISKVNCNVGFHGYIPLYLGGKGFEENFVSAVLQRGNGSAELGELEKHVDHSLCPTLPLEVVDGQL